MDDASLLHLVHLFHITIWIDMRMDSYSGTMLQFQL
jgi:hypothetical protein